MTRDTFSQSNTITRQDGVLCVKHEHRPVLYEFSYGPSKIGSAPVVTLSMQGEGVSDPH